MERVRVGDLGRQLREWVERARAEGRPVSDESIAREVGDDAHMSYATVRRVRLGQTRTIDRGHFEALRRYLECRANEEVEEHRWEPLAGLPEDHPVRKIVGRLVSAARGDPRGHEQFWELIARLVEGLPPRRESRHAS